MNLTDVITGTPVTSEELRAARDRRVLEKWELLSAGAVPPQTPSPLLRKRGTERGIHTTPTAHSKTDETVVSSVFSFCPESLLTHTLTQMRKGPERFRKRPRGHSPSHQLPAAGLRWSHVRRYPE